MDQHGFSSSADMGVGFARSSGSRSSGSRRIRTAPGLRKTEDDKYKKLSLQVLAGEAALNRKDGWNAGLAFSMEPISTEDSRTVMGLFGGWAGAGFRLGAEFDSKVVTGGRLDDQGNPADLTSTIVFMELAPRQLPGASRAICSWTWTSRTAIRRRTARRG